MSPLSKEDYISISPSDVIILVSSAFTLFTFINDSLPTVYRLQKKAINLESLIFIP
jgi:hypothetical protein